MYTIENMFSGGAFDTKTSVLMIAILAWSLVWKGLALWKAGRLGEKRWFVALLVVNTIGLFEIIYLFTENRKKLRVFLITVLAIGVAVLAFFLAMQMAPERVAFGDYGKAIYGTTIPDSATLANWKADCAQKLGVFNECGSMCDDSVEVCPAVCAYTCEQIPMDK